MSDRLGHRLTAVLGPTNTGKTHLAVDRMCGHASGMIGFPLRLLAREVYDRVVRIKGEAQVALITGEEKILPEGARYFLCTAESMPTDRNVAFVALDEAQTGADLERGHVFTDRLLYMRGYAETMILGSEMLRPLIRRLLPDAEIVTRPRFSTLSYAGPKKLSRLPRRSAIVAFSTQDVYALAEMLRRHKGGAAVVMGALSPRTRNAQVELYQSGEVDYLVATDAIGMGLNMDIAHVAFAALSKFDGRRNRRLTTAEMAQIAGRAGRHQRDGSFGSVQLGQEAGDSFEPEEIDAIENHVFPPLTRLVWRNGRLDWGSLGRLIAALDEPAPRPELMRAEDAVDLSVLKTLAQDEWVQGRARAPAMLQRLWAACGLPDYRKTGSEQHGRLVGRVFRHLSEGHGLLPADWIARELAALDNVQGDIATLSDRIAGVRTWTYVAHRANWLEDASHWAERSRALEDKLSDALHQRLTQRFVDRRTAVLMRDLGARQRDLAVAIDSDGAVLVEGEVIGMLHGFRFHADPTARAGETRRLLAAAERHLSSHLAERAQQLARDEDGVFALDYDGGLPPHLSWRGCRVAALMPGRDALSPRVVLDRSLQPLPPRDRALVEARLNQWLDGYKQHHLAALIRVRTMIEPETGLSPVARGLAVQLVEQLGCLERSVAAAQLAQLPRNDRKTLTQAGVLIGATHLFIPALLRPGPTRLRLALWAVDRQIRDIPVPPPGRVTINRDPQAPAGWHGVAGFHPVGSRAVRIDMIERLARAMQAQRDGRTPFVPEDNWLASLGLGREDFVRLMRLIGYGQRVTEGGAAFEWRGMRPPRRPHAVDAAVESRSPFAVLKAMRRR